MSDWILSRTDTAESIALPQDFCWKDEFDWSAVAQTEPQYSLSGSLIIQQGVKLAGRPITLSGDWVWVPRETAETLRAWSDVPELEMTLSHYNGTVYNVVFRTHEAAISEAVPVSYRTPETAAERYTFKVLLMTI